MNNVCFLIYIISFFCVYVNLSSNNILALQKGNYTNYLACDSLYVFDRLNEIKKTTLNETQDFYIIDLSKKDIAQLKSFFPIHGCYLSYLYIDTFSYKSIYDAFELAHRASERLLCEIACDKKYEEKINTLLQSFYEQSTVVHDEKTLIIDCGKHTEKKDIALSSLENDFIQSHCLPDCIEKKLTDIWHALSLDVKLFLNGYVNHHIDSQGCKAALERNGFVVHSLSVPQREINGGHAVLTHVDLDGYFIKCGFNEKFKRRQITRIVVADAVQKLLQKDSSFPLYVPQKFLFHKPYASWRLQDINYLVVVPAINGSHIAKKIGDAKVPKESFINEHLKHLFLQFKKSNIYKKIENLLGDTWDDKAWNFLVTDDESLYLIDTDPRWLGKDKQKLHELMERIVGQTIW